MDNMNNDSSLAEEEEVVTAFNEAAAPQKEKSGSPLGNRGLLILIISISVLAVGLAILAGWLFLDNRSQNLVISGNITVAGVNVNGMTQAEAIQAVTIATENTYSSKAMVVRVLDLQCELSPSFFRSFKVKAAVKEAYAYSQRNQSGAVNIAPYLSLDTEGIKEALAEFGKNYSTTLSQTTFEVTGTEPEQTLVIHLGVPEYSLDLNKLYEDVLKGYSRNVFEVEGECGLIAPNPIDLEVIHEQYYVAPANATYNKSFEAVEGVYGYGFDLEEAQKLLDEAKYGDTVEIPFVSIPPEVTAKDLTEKLYRDELATYTASSSSDVNRDVNLRQACAAINDLILYPGDVFSYNDTLGERTADKGYRPANSYAGNETVQTYGGGICQVSSSLYYCVMVADLEVIMRDPHGFATSYMPLGMDATVSWGSLDFRFRNNTDYPIRIVATSDGGSTTVSIMGTDERDYYVKMEYEVLSTIPFSVTYKTLPANNPDGYREGDYITSPYTGYNVKTYRCKYNKENDTLISKDFEVDSTYRSRDAVICKIQDGDTSSNTGTSTSPGIGNGGVTEGGDLPPELP